MYIHKKLLMKSRICAVCSSPILEDSICKNCGTNLSTILMLEGLPSRKTTSSEKAKILPDHISLVVLILLLGTGVGGFAYSLLFRRQSPTVQVQNQPTIKATIQELKVQPPSPNVISRQPHQKGCGGFYYTVRRRNSLSLIASRFYGNGSLVKFIVNANPSLKNREDTLYIGEQLFIPNREESCR